MACDRVQAFDAIFLPLFETWDTRVRAERKIRTRTLRWMLCLAPPLLAEAGLDGSETRPAVRHLHSLHGRNHSILSHGRAISVFSELTPSIWSINSEVAARTIFSNGMLTEWRS